MCGISGYIGREKLNKNKILNCLKSMRKEGPDHQSFVTHYNKSMKLIYLHLD